MLVRCRTPPNSLPGKSWVHSESPPLTWPGTPAVAFAREPTNDGQATCLQSDTRSLNDPRSMGQMVEFICDESGCDWKRAAMVGGGFRWLGHLPHLCRRCRHLTLVDGGPVPRDWDAVPENESVGRCSKCRRPAEPWPELNQDYEPNTPAECPRCQNKSVRFEYYGLWD